MKTCEEYKELIGAYVDRELSRMERMEVEAHIESCPQCAKYLEENEKLFANELYVMPNSVCQNVMARVNASVNEDLFSGETVSKEVEIEMRRKIRKRDGRKSWMIVAAMLAMVVGYYFLEGWVLGSRNNETAGTVVDEEVKLESVTEDSAGVIAGENAVPATAFRDAVAKAESVTVKFGNSKVVLFEAFKKEYIADYIASCPCNELEGRVEYKSVGSIKTDPDKKLNIQITDTHKVIFSYNGSIYEFDTQREDLLYAFQGVGILG